MNELYKCFALSILKEHKSIKIFNWSQIIENSNLSNIIIIK